MELTRNRCRQFKKGYERYDSPRYFLSFVEGKNEENEPELEPHLVVQMDTECSALYHKTCLDYNFEKPLPVSHKKAALSTITFNNHLNILYF